MCCVQKQNGDCHRWSHTLQLGSLLGFSHIQCQVGWGTTEEMRSGKQHWREKSIGIWLQKGSRYMCVGMCKLEHFIVVHVHYKCLTLLELIPMKSLQRTAVIQSLTTPLICWHLFSRMRKNSRLTAFQGLNKGNGLERCGEHITLGSVSHLSNLSPAQAIGCRRG